MNFAFEWDRQKAASNLRKHGISFIEATEVFFDPHALVEFDEKHSDEEDRFATIGMSEKLRVLLVVHTERGDVTRIISARQAAPTEQKRYEQHARRQTEKGP